MFELELAGRQHYVDVRGATKSVREVQQDTEACRAHVEVLCERVQLVQNEQDRSGVRQVLKCKRPK